MSRQVEWSEQWGEWIIVHDGVGRRLYLDCRAEAEEYLRITEGSDGEPYVWRRMEKWAREHRHNWECMPHWQRGADGASNN